MEVRVTDSFEIRAGMPGIKHAPGVVLVFDATGVGGIPKPGATVQLTPPNGVPLDVVVGEVKKHGPGRSFFVEGLTPMDAPIGSKLSWSAMGRTSRRSKPAKIVSARRR
jgi:hypothetical protein